jgi:hypothetical protein
MAKESRAAEIFRSQLKNQGILSSFATTAKERTKEKLDPRNWLLPKSGFSGAISEKIFGKGYKSGGMKDRTGTISDGSRYLVSSMNDVGTKLDDTNTNLKIIAKKSLVLPSIHQDTNIIRQNVSKIVKLMGGTATRKTDMYFLKSKEREEAYENQFNKENAKKQEPTKEEPTKESKSGGILGKISNEIISSMMNGIISSITSFFSPANLLKQLVTKFPLAILIGSIANGFIDGFKEWQESGELGKAALKFLSGLTFGFLDEKFFQDNIITPIVDFIENSVKAIKDVFTGKKDQIKELENLEKKPEADRSEADKKRIEELHKKNVYRTPGEARKAALEANKKRYGPEPTEPTEAAPTPAPTPVPTPAATGSTSTPAATAPTKFAETKAGGVTDTTKVPSSMNFDYNSYANALGKRESSNNYNADNHLGYIGKYQLGSMALESVGLMKPGSGKKGFKSTYDSSNWNINGGYQSFLNNPKMQEDAMKKYTMMNLSSLKRLNVINDNSSEQDAHLKGPGGAKDFILGGKESKDAFGTKISEYFDIGKKSQKESSTNIAQVASAPTTGSSISSASTQVATAQRQEMAASQSAATPSVVAQQSTPRQQSQSGKDQLLTAETARNTSFMDYLQSAYIPT